MFLKCKVEAYGAQKEFGTETCKPKLPFPFVPHTLLLVGSVVFKNFLFSVYGNIGYVSNGPPCIREERMIRQHQADEPSHKLVNFILFFCGIPMTSRYGSPNYSESFTMGPL